MSAERPWMKFYPQDWRADERLRNCSLGARGLWLEMLAIMHRSERYGYLLINGKAPSDRALAIQAGASVDEVASAQAELEAEGVFSRDPDGSIFSRRMIRDDEKHRKASNFGKRGVRAKARKDNEEQPPLEGTHEGTHKPPHEGTHQLRGQRPESPPVSPKVKGRVKAQAHPLPDDWEPKPFGPETQCHAIMANWSRLEFERQLEKFRARHQASDTRWANWQKAWATWVLNSVEFGPRYRSEDRSGEGGAGASGSFVDVVLAEAAGRNEQPP